MAKVAKGGAYLRDTTVHGYAVDLVVQLDNTIAVQCTTSVNTNLSLSAGSYLTIVSCTPQHSGATPNDLSAMWLQPLCILNFYINVYE